MLCSNHECIGEGCNICYEINLIKDIFDSLLILPVLISIIKIIQNGFINVKHVKIIEHGLTPVKLKVKISA